MKTVEKQEKKDWFIKDLAEGVKYNLTPSNTIKEFKELPKSALKIFAFLIIGLIIYFLIVGDYSFWGIFSIIGLIISSINLVLVDNGKITSFIWGFLASMCFLIGALNYGMYGEAIYHIWSFPWMIYGIAIWTKLARENVLADNSIRAKKVSVKQAGIYVGTFIASYGVMYLVSSTVGGAVPLVDSAVLAFGVIGQVMLSKSYRAQWIVWILQDIVAVIAWSVRLTMIFGTSDSISFPLSMIVMWSLFTVNALYGCWQWYHAPVIKNS